MKAYFHLCLVLALSLFLSGCLTDSRTEILATDKPQVALRAVQTRQFDTPDRQAVFRAVIATLQDLGFVIDNADDTLYTVSATKLQAYVMRMTVTIRSEGADRVAVRASADYNIDAVSDAKPYDRFFSALSKSLFLAANKVD